MKKAALIGLGLLFTAGAANALPFYNESRKFFDESGSIVGQQVVACNGTKAHAGNVHTAYFIEELILCEGAGGQSPPTVNYIVPGTLITNYTLPGALSIQQACTPAECESSSIPEIQELTDKGWTWLNGSG